MYAKMAKRQYHMVEDPQTVFMEHFDVLHGFIIIPESPNRFPVKNCVIWKTDGKARMPLLTIW